MLLLGEGRADGVYDCDLNGTVVYSPLLEIAINVWPRTKLAARTNIAGQQAVEAIHFRLNVCLPALIGRDARSGSLVKQVDFVKRTQWANKLRQH